MAEGALWIEESLPSETLLIGLMTAEPSRREKAKLTDTEVLDVALPGGGEILQLGGKATIGRGRCRIARWS